VATRGAQTGVSVAPLGLSRSILIVHDVGTMFTSEAVTRGVRVHVQSEYAAERSQPSQNQWFFLYTITISNEGPEAVQLLTRHWVITDGKGHVEEVRGPGVVGKQPVLEPGESFTYTSGCPLETPFGVMEGTYQMVTAGGDHFDARIAPFTLSEPYTVH
jgi:ApaG protein